MTWRVSAPEVNDLAGWAAVYRDLAELSPVARCFRPSVTRGADRALAAGPRPRRGNDGDTQVADHLRLRGAELLRTMSVLTDGLYGERILLRYTRAS